MKLKALADALAPLLAERPQALADALAPLIAPRVAAELAERFVPEKPDTRVGPGLVDAAAVAAALGVRRGWVYEHADELGAVRLGHGKRARLRFDLDAVKALHPCSGGKRTEGAESPASAPKTRRRQRSSSGTSGALLPIRGREAA